MSFYIGYGDSKVFLDSKGDKGLMVSDDDQKVGIKGVFKLDIRDQEEDGLTWYEIRTHGNPRFVN